VDIDRLTASTCCYRDDGNAVNRNSDHYMGLR